MSIDLFSIIVIYTNSSYIFLYKTKLIRFNPDNMNVEIIASFNDIFAKRRCVSTLWHAHRIPCHGIEHEYHHIITATTPRHNQFAKCKNQLLKYYHRMFIWNNLFLIRFDVNIIASYHLLKATPWIVYSIFTPPVYIERRLLFCTKSHVKNGCHFVSMPQWVNTPKYDLYITCLLVALTDHCIEEKYFIALFVV